MFSFQKQESNLSKTVSVQKVLLLFLISLGILWINIWFIVTILIQVNLTKSQNIEFHTLLLVPKVWCLALPYFGHV